MAILYICYLGDGRPSHIHEQTDPPGDTPEKVAQSCIGENGIVSAELVAPENINDKLAACVASGVYSQADIDQVKKNYTTRLAAEHRHVAVPITGDIDNG